MLDIRPNHVITFAVLFVLWTLARVYLPISFFDDAVYLAAQTLSNSEWWLKFWYAVTFFGKGALVVTVLVYLAVVYVNNARSVRSVVFVILSTILFNSVTPLKILFALPRPVGFAAFVPDPASFTYPSGHAVGAVLLLFFAPQFFLRVVMTNLEIPEDWRWLYSRTLQYIGIALIALSRVFLGVHWFSDIVGGVLWGFFISQLALYFFDRKMLHEIQSRYLRS